MAFTSAATDIAVKSEKEYYTTKENVAPQKKKLMKFTMQSPSGIIISREQILQCEVITKVSHEHQVWLPWHFKMTSININFCQVVLYLSTLFRII